MTEMNARVLESLSGILDAMGPGEERKSLFLHGFRILLLRRVLRLYMGWGILLKSIGVVLVHSGTYISKFCTFPGMYQVLSQFFEETEKTL